MGSPDRAKPLVNSGASPPCYLAEYAETPGIGLKGEETPPTRSCHSRLLPGVIAKRPLGFPTLEA
jgi:hypothetical protein